MVKDNFIPHLQLNQKLSGSIFWFGMAPEYYQCVSINQQFYLHT